MSTAVRLGGQTHSADRAGLRWPRRMAALGAVALVAGLALAPAAHAAAPSVTISSPGSNQIVADATPTVAGSASMNNGVIQDLTVTISSDAGHPVPPPYRLAGEDRSSVPFSWTPTLTYNGRYSVVARATGADRPVDTNGTEVGQATRQFGVEAPPARPRGVKASVDTETRFVNVTWTNNTEPDLLGYQVQRAVGDSDSWAVAGESTQNAFQDKRTADGGGGTYRYRVVAVRKGASSTSGVSSDPSTAASADVPAPRATTTTTAPPNNPGGGDGGGSGGGGGTTTTVPGDSPDPQPSGSGGGGGTDGSSSSGPGSAPNTGPVISKSGKVNLSGFSILDGTKAPAVQSTEAPDEGFSETLPFDEVPIDAGGEDGEVASGGLLNDNSADRRVMLTFLAAGLLATVLLMHLLWIKGEVDRVPLEPLPPEGAKLPGRLKAPGRQSQ